MKLKNAKFLQEGGPMPQGGPAPEQGQDPMAMLMQGAQQALQAQDCEVAMQVCQMLLELAGGGAPQEAAPAEAAPVPAEGEPVYRRGGKLSRRIIG